MTDEHGPHREALLAQVERLNAIQWLSPDAAMDTQSDEAQQWIRDRLDEHLAALAEFHAEPNVLGQPSIEIFRSIPPLVSRALSLPVPTVKSAPKDPREPMGPPQVPIPPGLGSAMPPLTAHGRAWRDALNKALTESYAGSAHKHSVTAISMVPHVYYKLPNEHILRTSWLEPLWGSPTTMNHPGYPALTAHLRWVAAFGIARPSPWDAIIAMFERGLWPVVSNDGALLLWIPLRVNGVPIADENGDSTVPNTFRFTQVFLSGSAEGYQDIRAFHERGFAPIPIMCVSPPTPNLAPPRPQIPLPENVMSANPPPPPPNLEAPDPNTPTENVPWYRKLFGTK